MLTTQDRDVLLEFPVELGAESCFAYKCRTTHDSKLVYQDTKGFHKKGKSDNVEIDF